MRTIKFRGRRLDNGEWVYGDLLHTSGGKVEIHWLRKEKDGDLNPWWAVADPETVGQFTELLDQEGGEIYEGDIVLAGDSEGVVEFGRGRFGINWDYRTGRRSMIGTFGSADNLRGLNDGYNREIKVVGTILD